ncbi:MAG: hypothetical protein U0988_08455 [Allopontixanthobacter sp.]|nr:hypothetical protein [Allopontixanthobacter sp.]MDZ4307874.1 hypothetical protein [Allopontixanthobacter sp.]
MKPIVANARIDQDVMLLADFLQRLRVDVFIELQADVPALDADYAAQNVQLHALENPCRADIDGRFAHHPRTGLRDAFQRAGAAAAPQDQSCRN